MPFAFGGISGKQAVVAGGYRQLVEFNQHCPDCQLPHRLFNDLK